jgi:homoserine dehydrogenase
LGIADMTDAGLSLRVHPAFVHEGHPLATTSGSFNAVSVYGNWVGHTLYYGRGAGSKPTASAVVADLVDIGVGNAGRTFEHFAGVFNDRTEPPTYADMKDLETRYYVRLLVDDRPGVMAQITQVFGDRGISLTAVEQHELPEGEKADAVPVMVLTHLAAEGRMQDALNELAGLDAIREHPVMIRVVEEHEEYAS